MATIFWLTRDRSPHSRSIISMVYTLRLVGSISYLGGCYWRTKVTKCIRQKMTLFSAVLISVCETLNDIHQDTKSARLIAVCKRSITLNKFGKRARGCCVHVFLVSWCVGAEIVVCVSDVVAVTSGWGVASLSAFSRSLSSSVNSRNKKNSFHYI